MDIESKVFYLIRKAFLIAVATTVIGLLVPGFSAYEEGIFDAESMINHAAPMLEPKVQEQLRHYQQLKSGAEQKLLEINKIFMAQGPLTNEQIAALTAQRTVAEQLAQANPPVTFLPFYLSSAMLLWVLSLTPLAWLALLLYPGRSAFDSLSPFQVVGTGLLAHVSYQWTVWMRYFVLKNNGRKVVGFANYDISHVSRLSWK